MKLIIYLSSLPYTLVMCKSLSEQFIALQVTTDGTQLDSQQTLRPLPATARSRSSTRAGPCSELLVRILQYDPASVACMQHEGSSSTRNLDKQRAFLCRMQQILSKLM